MPLIRPIIGFSDVTGNSDINIIIINIKYIISKHIEYASVRSRCIVAGLNALFLYQFVICILELLFFHSCGLYAY